MPEAIEQLARNVFRRPESKIRTILAMSIPSKRAFMHLDTVMTQVDVDKFVVHPAILPTLRIFEVTQGKGGELTARQLDMDLAHALAHYLHLDQVTLILCGGQDQIAAQREQWNDGSNTLCIRPGVVIAYDRNYITNEILESYGITVLKIPSGELSRGRGGPPLHEHASHSGRQILKKGRNNTMPVNLRGRHYLKLLDYTPAEIRYLLELSKDFKRMKRSGTPPTSTWLARTLSCCLKKTSTRTRCSFEVAGRDLGLGVTYLDPGSSQMGKKESIADTARVLGRMFDGIEYRGFSQKTVEDLAHYAGVPVWNGLTDEFHPHPNAGGSADH